MDFVERGLRALGFRIELGDGLDLVAEELDADGTVVLRRVDVEDSAAARELAGHLDEVHLGVADRGEMAGENFDVDFFAAAKGDGETGVILAIEEAKRGCFNGCDEDVDGAGGEFPQGCGTLLLHVGMGREILEREHVVGGQADDTRGIDGAGELASGFQHGFERFGGLVVSDDEDDRLAGGARHEGNVEGAGGGSQSGDTSSPRIQAQVPDYAFKTRGVLQLRKNFADKREDHECLVYQCWG